MSHEETDANRYARSLDDFSRELIARGRRASFAVVDPAPPHDGADSDRYARILADFDRELIALGHRAGGPVLDGSHPKDADIQRALVQVYAHRRGMPGLDAGAGRGDTLAILLRGLLISDPGRHREAMSATRGNAGKPRKGRSPGKPRPAVAVSANVVPFVPRAAGEGERLGDGRGSAAVVDMASRRPAPLPFYAREMPSGLSVSDAIHVALMHAISHALADRQTGGPPAA